MWCLMGRSQFNCETLKSSSNIPLDMDLDEFTEEVRSCRVCNPGVEPFIAGSDTSKILVVSERPPDKNVHDDFGGYWRRPGMIPVFGACRMLGIFDELNSHDFFWIHRSNCYNGSMRKCSERYLRKCIELVNPELVLIFGSKAAAFFFPNKEFKDAVGSRKWEGKHNVIVLPHFSSAARGAHKVYGKQIEKARREVRHILGIA